MLATVAAVVIAGASAAFADTMAPLDGDTYASNGNITYGAGARPCDTRGEPVDGTATIKFNGNDHFVPGETLDVTFTPSVPGIEAKLTEPAVVPETWDSGADDFTIYFATTVAETAVSGSVDVTVAGATYALGEDEGSGRPHFQVGVDCPAAPPATNHAPSVSLTNPPATANEGDIKTFNFSISDADASDSHSFVSGFPDCGAGNELVSSSMSSGTFSCKFPDGVKPAIASTVRVQVSDGTDTSNIDTTDVTVSNVAPTVAAPGLGSSPVDCRSSVTLSGISFSDPGVKDNPWTVDINWGDGSAHTTFNASAQGGQTDQSHSYNAPGTYTPRVTVTDKDGDSSYADSTTSLVVKQVYTTDFLPPFDDSTPSGLIVNQMKNGRVVPVKATIYDVCAQNYVTSSAVTVGVTKVATPTTTPAPDAIESYADAGASSGNTSAFRWTADATSPGGGFWIYNLDSKALTLVTNSYYRVDIYVGGVQATKTDWGILQPLK